MMNPKARHLSGRAHNLAAQDKVTLRVKQVAALAQMCRLAIEFGPPNDKILHDAVSAIADLAGEAQDALSCAFDRAA